AQATAAQLQAQVSAEQRKIASTHAGLVSAEQRLARLQARAAKRQKQLDETQNKLVTSRVHLTKLQSKSAKAQKQLANNLRASSEGTAPTLTSVVLNADGFTDLLERIEFLKRIAKRNATILRDTRNARDAVQKQTNSLGKLRNTYSSLAKSAVA